MPKGTIIVSKLTAFIRSQMRLHRFQEVITPQLFKNDLWKQSGHWDYYNDDMFSVSGGQNFYSKHVCSHHSDIVENEEYSLKPMNCPGHCLVYKSQSRSFRDLPIRYSDFSPLHRNEASGALTGLTRVRRFHQDDGHIFCRPDQVGEEISKSLQLVDTVYRVFGLKHEKLLSTRPENYIGDIEVWNKAEADLKNVLGTTVTINEGDGAFYGPKIDFVVTDNLGKQHQAATIQLDFQLPRNFQLTYDDDSMQESVPVMIHRAVLGSVERFVALLIDHYDGKWPFWLNPLQGVVIPVSQAHERYAKDVADMLSGRSETSSPTDEFDVELWSQAEPLGGRIRRAIENAASYLIVVGDREVESCTVSIRDRDGGPKQTSMKAAELLQKFRDRRKNLS